MSGVFIEGAIFGFCAGIVLAVCGFKFTGWRYWVLLFALCIAFNVGKSLA